MGFISDSISATTISANTLYITSVGSGTPQISLGLDSNFQVVTGSSDNNIYTTGTTISGNVVEFNRTDTQNAYDVNLSGITYTNIITSPTQIATNVDTTNDYLGITGSAVLTDEASNYGGVWSNGSNQGTGFNPWAIITQPNTGVFIGNPASGGMLTTGIGTTAFGLFCNSTPNSVNASRPFTSPLEVGDVFSFYWAVNFDGAPNGNKGFDLKAGGNLIFNADIAASSSILSNLPLPYNVIDSGYGTTPMLVTLTRTTNTQYTITITSRSGGPTYSAPINSSLGIDEVNFYNVDQPGGFPDERNLYFNKLEIIKAASLNKISVDELKIALNVSTGLYSAGTGTDSTVRINTSNFANGNCSIVASGSGNTATGQYSIISGGRENTSSGIYSTVSGGRENTSIGDYSTISGGYRNKLSLPSPYSFIGGGTSNLINIGDSVIGGGQGNRIGIIGAGSFSLNTYSVYPIPAGTYNVTQSSTTISGYGAEFSIIIDSSYNLTSWSLINGGQNYVNGEQITINGDQFPLGTIGVNDFIFDVISTTDKGVRSVIGGGEGNFAFGFRSFIGSGYYNTASGYGSVIGGGGNNTSSGYYSTVSGGLYNTSSNYYSTVSGGLYNKSSGYYSTVGGGFCNTSSEYYSTVSGGYQNKAKVDGSTIGGGQCNVVGVIGGVGGVYNESYLGSTLNGIFTNISPTSNLVGTGAGATFNFGFTLGVFDFVTINNIGEGYQNGDQLLFDGTLFGGIPITDDVTLNVNATDFGQQSTVSGGIRNTTSFYSSTVSGGAQNTANRNYATIGGGVNNISSGDGSFIGAGLQNTISQQSLSIIGGGRCNTVSSNYGIIVGGGNNDITQTGTKSNIGGGSQNTIQSEVSNINGGRCNTLGGTNTITTVSVYGSYNGNPIQDGSYLVTPTSTLGSGSGAQLNISFSGYYVSGTFVNFGGINYQVNDTITFDGGLFSGGTSGVNDITFNVDLIDTAIGNCSIISGGYCNILLGNYSSIGGGVNNTISAYNATIGGGQANTASGYQSTIGGGTGNTAIGTRSVIAGGIGNFVNSHASVLGGSGNKGIGAFSSIGGGIQNTTEGCVSFIGGGRENTSSCNYSTISGGFRNTIDSITTSGAYCVYGSTIGGGSCNTISATYSSNYNSVGNTISGGHKNTTLSSAYYNAQTISGGYCNLTLEAFATIGGGRFNTASLSSVVAGGDFNKALCGFTTIGGGQCNTTLENVSTIAGGTNNTTLGCSSNIGGGVQNTTINSCSAILGGQCNTAQHDYSFIVGSGIFSTAACTTHMNCLNLKNIPVDPGPGTLPLGTVYRCSIDSNRLYICV